ncbi:MAG: hypothetical protein NZ602_09035 [Thermoguttaceae bacterium]|nr:hypothetical protein [Thermoguttaceae bacterium]MDW8038635.1 hypothetical protein [Thermoguttaceae bacterium]
MKKWAWVLAGLVVGSFLLADWQRLVWAQGPQEGPWLNAASEQQASNSAGSGWRAKRAGAVAIPTQAMMSSPWPASAPSASRASVPAAGGNIAGRGTLGGPGSGPPGFWSPARGGSSGVRIAQQPVGTGNVPPRELAPSIEGSPSQSSAGSVPEASATVNGVPGAPEVIPPGQPSPISQPSQQIPMPSPSAGGAEEGYYPEEAEGCWEDACFGPCWGPGAYWGYPVFYGLFRDLTLFGGAHAFKGPVDGGINANFGLHEGVNFSGPLGDPWGGGFQIGFQAVHSNFRGYARRIYDGALGAHPVVEPPLETPTNGAWAQHSFIVTNGDRDQLFFTAGLFRRAPMGGLQWGVVFDLMHDAYYYTADLKQLRAELSLVWPGWREIGFWGAFGVGNERVTDQFTYRRQDNQQEATYRLDFALEPTDQFNFFYRQYFCNGGEGRLWIGFTGNTDVLFGGDLWIPLSEHFALENSFNILFPKETGEATQREHAWSVMIQLVWYPGRSAKASTCNMFRPLFGVADNTSFLVDRKANPIP